MLHHTVYLYVIPHQELEDTKFSTLVYVGFNQFPSDDNPPWGWVGVEGMEECQVCSCEILQN